MKVLTNYAKICCFTVVVLAVLFCIPTVQAPFAQMQGSSKAQILMDYGTGEVMSETNSREKLPIASVTKLTTLLLAFEAIERGDLDLDKKLTASQTAAGMGGSQVFIDLGGEYSVQSLLHAIIISSANDASVMIAEELAGTEQNFVDKMNARVTELGGKNTNYGNCTGLPCATAYSCAYDVALVMRAVLSHSLYFEMSNIWMEDFAHSSGRVTQMANTNKLLRTYNGCDAGKTGSTSEAGFCLCASAKRGDMRLISVVLGAPDSKARFAESAALLDYGFDNFVSNSIMSSTDVIDADFAVPNSKNSPVISPAESFSTINKRGEEKNLDIHYEFAPIKAPLSAGSVVGKAIISDDGIVVKEIDLVLQNDLIKNSLWDNIRSITTNW